MNVYVFFEWLVLHISGKQSGVYWRHSETRKARFSSALWPFLEKRHVCEITSLAEFLKGIRDSFLFCLQTLCRIFFCIFKKFPQLIYPFVIFIFFWWPCRGVWRDPQTHKKNWRSPHVTSSSPFFYCCFSSGSFFFLVVFNFLVSRPNEIKAPRYFYVRGREKVRGAVYAITGPRSLLITTQSRDFSWWTLVSLSLTKNLPNLYSRRFQSAAKRKNVILIYFPIPIDFSSLSN